MKSPKQKKKVVKTVKAYAVIATRSRLLKVDRMGTSQNPYYSIHPQTAEGRRYAESNCNGYEQVVEVDITFSEPKPHKCNC